MSARVSIRLHDNLPPAAPQPVLLMLCSKAWRTYFTQPLWTNGLNKRATGKVDVHRGILACAEAVGREVFGCCQKVAGRAVDQDVKATQLLRNLPSKPDTERYEACDGCADTRVPTCSASQPLSDSEARGARKAVSKVGARDRHALDA